MKNWYKPDPINTMNSITESAVNLLFTVYIDENSFYTSVYLFLCSLVYYAIVWVRYEAAIYVSLKSYFLSRCYGTTGVC